MRISHSKVMFPTPGSENRMNHVLVQAYLDLHNGKKSCSFDGKLGEIKRQIGIARDGEGIDTLDICVIVRFDDDDFSCLSYGLALAIADKLARFPQQTDPPVICATGKLGNKGVVSSIRNFSDKVDIVEATLGRGALFVYPIDNWKESPDGIRRLEAKGISVKSVNRFEELSWLWTQTCQDVPSPTSSLPQESVHTPLWTWFLKGGAVGFFVIIAAAVGWGLLGVA